MRIRQLEPNHFNEKNQLMKRLFLPLMLIASMPILAMHSVEEISEFVNSQLETVCNEKGNTLLMRSVLGGNSNVIQMMLSRNSELVNAQNDAGLTALHIAAVTRNLAICKILVAHGADVWASTKKGLNVFDVASKAGICYTEFCRGIGLINDITLSDLRLKK